MPSVDTFEGVEVRRLRLTPGDHIVLLMDERYYKGSAEDLVEQARLEWPGYPVTVLTHGIEIAILSMGHP